MAARRACATADEALSNLLGFHWIPADTFLDGFREGMRVQGYVEGRTSALGTFETAAELGECLLIGVDRKSSAHPQNDLIDPNPTSASDPTGAEHRRCETIHIQIARLELSGCGPV